MTGPDPISPPPASPPPAPAPQAGMSRGWKIAFALSVALNLAVLGLVAGAFLRHGGPMMQPGAVADGGFGPLAEALEDDDRRGLRRDFLSSRPDIREIRKERRADAARLMAVLRAEPFDPAALQSALAEASRRTADRVAHGQSLLVSRIAAMAPAERAAFADRLERALSRGRDRDDRDDRDGDGRN